MESDKFKLGLFLILSFIICCFLFVVFGLFDYGEQKVNAVVLFKESVKGLEVGSTVQLRGVPIGRVKDITFSMEDKLIRVDMELDVKKVRMRAEGGDVETEANESAFFDLLEREIGKGLCAQIQMNGITGGKSIVFDYVDSGTKLPPYAISGFHNNVFYIPSRPSAISDITNRVHQTLAKIAQIDFKGLSEKTDKLLISAEKLVSDPALTASLKNIDELTVKLNKTVENINQSLPAERIAQLTDEAQKTLVDTRKTIKLLETEIEKAKLGETTAAIRDASDTLSDNKRLVKDSLVRLGTALDRLSELLQTIEENPEAFIQGKKK